MAISRKIDPSDCTLTVPFSCAPLPGCSENRKSSAFDFPFHEVLARCPSSDDQPSELLHVLGHFWKNRRLTDAIFAGTPRRILALSLSEMIEAHLRERGETLLLPVRLVAIQLAEAKLALVESWLRGRAFARAEDVATALHRSSRESANSLISVS